MHADLHGWLDSQRVGASPLSDFGYEYLKDVRAYILIVIIVYLYRFMLRRLQGEAGFLSQNEGVSDKVPDQFLVKKLGREFLVKVADIEWIQSCGNYVNLHIGDRIYMLRETMAGIQRRLEPLGFQRVHRSAIVNLSEVREIFANSSGDGELNLQSAVRLPVSRRYRQELRNRLRRETAIEQET